MFPTQVAAPGVLKSEADENAVVLGHAVSFRSEGSLLLLVARGADSRRAIARADPCTGRIRQGGNAAWKGRLLTLPPRSAPGAVDRLALVPGRRPSAYTSGAAEKRSRR